MAKKDQEKVNFLEPEETNESKTRLVKNGHTYKVVLTWRGKTYMVQMFVPSVSRPTRQQIEKEVQKLYPDAKVMSFLPRDLEPGEPTVMMGEEKRDEYGDIVGGPKISKKQLKKNLASNEKDEKITRSEEYVTELKKKTLGSYIRKASGDMAGKAIDKDMKGVGKRFSGIQKATKKLETEEYISELSPGTLGSYVKKASFDVYDTSSRLGGTSGEVRKDLNDTIAKRSKGIYKATDKLVKKAGKPPEKRNTIRGASPDSTQYISQEEYVSEDDMKGMSVKSGHKRPTKSGAGMTAKGVAAYRRRNPGSKLKTAVTGKVKKGSKDANRRKSYCARSAGQMKKFPKAAKDPNSRLRQARRRWKC